MIVEIDYILRQRLVRNGHISNHDKMRYDISNGYKKSFDDLLSVS